MHAEHLQKRAKGIKDLIAFGVDLFVYELHAFLAWMQVL